MVLTLRRQADCVVLSLVRAFSILISFNRDQSILDWQVCSLKSKLDNASSCSVIWCLADTVSERGREILREGESEGERYLERSWERFYVRTHGLQKEYHGLETLNSSVTQQSCLHNIFFPSSSFLPVFNLILLLWRISITQPGYREGCFCWSPVDLFNSNFSDPGVPALLHGIENNLRPKSNFNDNLAV